MKTNKRLSFTKMHGLGNDFVILDALKNKLDVSQLPIEQLANRHIGIGFDQLLIIEPSTKADFFCRIYNADGSEAEQCGNGLRCVARYLHEGAYLPQTSFTLETKAGIFPVTIESYDQIRITFAAPKTPQKTLDVRSAVIDAPINVLSMGNPHAIVKVNSLDAIPVQTLGRDIASLPDFSHGANVGFVQIIRPDHIRLRTFERGVGETFACGSNACAAVIVGVQNGWLKPKVTVEFAYGALSIEWQGKDTPIHMTGPAALVFAGELLL